MRKILIFGLLFASSLAWGRGVRDLEKEDVIGPTLTTNAYSSVAAPEYRGARNCLTEITASPSAAAAYTNITVRILEGGTTIYAVDASTGNVVHITWPDNDPFCVGPGRSLAVTTAASATTTINLNYRGYVYK